jgi:hypothetical protein
MNDQEQSSNPGISRRTLAKGIAWAVPVVAVAVAAPVAAASVTPNAQLPTCVSDLQVTGGTYPVAVNFTGCGQSSAHWDFNFKLTVTASDACNCNYVRITFYDNPNRSTLWFNNENRTTPKYYVQKVLPVGTTAVFPTTGDTVYRADNKARIGTITAPGSENDSVHVNFCKTGPMATYDVECSTSANGPWTILSTGNVVNPCVPLIAATACKTRGASTYTLAITASTLNGAGSPACSVPAASYTITNVQRSSSNTDPTQGTSIWKGSTGLGKLVVPNSGSGSYLWISFTTGDGNTSRIIVNTPTSTCA